MALVKIGVAASRLGLSTKQLRTLDKKGLIKTVRTEGKTRLFDVNGYVAKLESDKINETLSGLVVAHAEPVGPPLDQTNRTPATEEQPAAAAAENAVVAQPDPWKADVEAVFKAIKENSAGAGKFPICFEKAAEWIGFTEKSSAKRHLLKNFDKNEDFIISAQKLRLGRFSESDQNSCAATGPLPERIFVSAECFKGMCMTANTAQGKRVRRHYLELERRWQEGDLTLAGEIVQNYDKANGTKTNVLLQTQEGGQLPTWVPKWREKRTVQMEDGKTLRDVLKDLNISDASVYAIVENLQNQSVYCFDGSSARYKKENGIPDYKALAEAMDTMQLDLRRMMSVKLVELYQNLENPSVGDIKKVAEGVKERVAEMSRYMGCDEYRPKEDDGGNKMYIGKRVRQLEVAHRRSVRRLATIERKQKLLEDVPIVEPTDNAQQRRIGDFFKT